MGRLDAECEQCGFPHPVAISAIKSVHYLFLQSKKVISLFFSACIYERWMMNNNEVLEGQPRPAKAITESIKTLLSGHFLGGEEEVTSSRTDGDIQEGEAFKRSPLRDHGKIFFL